jgi:hypothetical protein
MALNNNHSITIALHYSLANVSMINVLLLPYLIQYKLTYIQVRSKVKTLVSALEITQVSI